jgi:hypothetical protein
MGLEARSKRSRRPRSDWINRGNPRSGPKRSGYPNATDLKATAFVALERVKLARFTLCWLNTKEAHFPVAVRATQQGLNPGFKPEIWFVRH